MKEQSIQKKIITKLEADGHEVVKVITANKSGIADILTCSPAGKFWCIEVKRPGFKPSELQWDFIRRVQDRNGIAFYADSYDDFLIKYNKCTVSQTNCFKAPTLKKTFVDL